MAGKTKNFVNRRQSEERKFETVQRIDKLTDVSSTLNGLQNGTKLGCITPRGFDATCGEN